MTANQEPASVLPADQPSTSLNSIAMSRIAALCEEARGDVEAGCKHFDIDPRLLVTMADALSSTRAELAGSVSREIYVDQLAKLDTVRALMFEVAGENDRLRQQLEERGARVPEVAPIAEVLGSREGASESPEGRHGVYDSLSLAVFADVILGRWDNNRCRAELHEYVRHLRTMEASLDEGARDRERLNWLEGRFAVTAGSNLDESDGFYWCDMGSSTPTPLREAIDAARRSDGKATDGK